MIKYIIDTSKGDVNIIKIKAEKTTYDNIKCIKNDGSCVFKRLDQCFDSYEDAKKHIDEMYYISNFKKRMKNQKYKGWKCAYCGRIMYHKTDVTVDHVIPKRKGGQTTDDNLVICCSSCNKMKSSKHKDHYIKLMKNNAKIKIDNPKKFSGKISKIAHKSHGLDIETIARMDSNVISMNGLNLNKNKQNMVDKILNDYNSKRAVFEN